MFYIDINIWMLYLLENITLGTTMVQNLSILFYFTLYDFLWRLHNLFIKGSSTAVKIVPLGAQWSFCWNGGNKCLIDQWIYDPSFSV